MTIGQKGLFRGAIWTTGTYAVSVVLRFATNVILSRLVVPEVFGAMLLISTLRNGIDLMSDVGLSQNVVNSKNGENRRFLNTIWTVQILRGVVLFSLLFAAAAPLGQLYDLPTDAIRLFSVGLLIIGGASVSIYLLQRRLQFARFNLFELGIDVVNAALVVALALYSPTIWSLIVANLLTLVVRSVVSYALPDGLTRFAWERSYTGEIFSFGKWIFLSSLLMFLCASFDRLYLGQAIPLAMLGIYGIARSIADLPSALMGRISHQLVFPVIAARKEEGPEVLRRQMRPLRLKLLGAAAACIALGVSFADVAIWIIYDSRYHEAGWILPVLLLGIWGSMLCMISEYVLLGVGRPIYGAAGNMAKLGTMVVAVPLGFHLYGLVGAIVAIAAADIGRYLVVLFGQYRERIGFFRQDVVLSLALLLLVALMSAARWQAGYGTAFDGMIAAAGAP